MDGNVSKSPKIDHEHGPVIGSQIIDIVTAGMYSNPLAVIREYVQNAADSIDVAYDRGLLSPGEECIDIKINGINRSVSITDNGTGVLQGDLEARLRGLGRRQKDRLKQRGFRGIGRLGGLGYCDQVVFETRADKSEPVSILIWDGKKLQELASHNGRRLSAEEAIDKAVSVEVIKPRPGDLPRFFRVTMRNVHRFHRDELMNPKIVAGSLGRVAPVEFDDDRFEFASKIRHHVSDVPGYRTYNIFLNGYKIARPHANKVPLHGQNLDEIKGIETFDIRDSGGREIGRGWYAVTKYLAALPPQVAMRGLRVRQGNIEIGDEYFLADLFSERRFAAWHIGEVHLNYSVKVNARRDGFEQSTEFETFLEQMQCLCGQLSGLCRDSSKLRSKEKSIENTLDRIEELLSLQVILDKEELARSCDQTQARILEIANAFGESVDLNHLKQRLDGIRLSMDQGLREKSAFADIIDGRCTHIAPKELLQEIAKAVLNTYDGKMSKDKLLFEIFGRYMRKNSLKKLLQA
jgi:Histidine kinase-, DNA gyrase B-, and HSP90-like ATPase